NKGIRALQVYLYDGEGWFDRFALVPSSCAAPIASAPTISSTEVPWIDDAVPSGMNDTTWDTTQKASGTRSMRSVNASGSHLLQIMGGSSTLFTSTGDHLSFYWMLNPCVMPREVKVVWLDTATGVWHGVWWGEALLGGESGLLSQGPMPSGGTW